MIQNLTLGFTPYVSCQPSAVSLSATRTLREQLSAVFYLQSDRSGCYLGSKLSAIS
ncbi:MULTISPECIES: hypothetical protein [Moorena]|uniref:hypothetical protein n=1 Tax=Moorena TaxID=1155738 RepID=UPI001300D03C|nr:MULTISPECIES: hypothetical protein [Moorena]NEO24121.1 hypothetical protein [Moorena sp. SIO4A5]